MQKGKSKPTETELQVPSAVEINFNLRFIGAEYPKLIGQNGAGISMTPEPSFPFSVHIHAISFWELGTR